MILQVTWSSLKHCC